MDCRADTSIYSVLQVFDYLPVHGGSLLAGNYFPVAVAAAIILSFEDLLINVHVS